jgi:hypothetical protein
MGFVGVRQDLHAQGALSRGNHDGFFGVFGDDIFAAWWSPYCCFVFRGGFWRGGGLDYSDSLLQGCGSDAG